MWRPARADARPDEITFEDSSATVKHVSVHFAGGTPRDLSIYGPAPLSPTVLAAIKAQKNNVLTGYLDGLDLRSKEGTSVTLLVLPTGAAEDRKFTEEFSDDVIGTVAGYANFAPSPSERRAASPTSPPTRAFRSPRRSRSSASTSIAWSNRAARRRSNSASS